MMFFLHELSLIGWVFLLQKDKETNSNVYACPSKRISVLHCKLIFGSPLPIQTFCTAKYPPRALLPLTPTTIQLK